MRRSITRRIVGAVAVLLAVGAGVTGTTPSGAAPTQAAETPKTIHPGVQMITEGGQCTANFVFTDGQIFYLGYAAHCASTGGATETNGCDAGSLPLGTRVQIQGATMPGVLAYSSWLAMQSGPRPDANTCQYNDFALVEIHRGDWQRISASIPHWGGPTGVNTTGTGLLSSVYSYGNSQLRLGITLLSPKTGVSLGTTGGGWTHPVYTITPGIPGDSGSALLDAQGRGVGILSTLALLPTPLSNNYTDLNKAMEYARAHGVPELRLMTGSGFNPNQLPLDLGYLGL